MKKLSFTNNYDHREFCGIKLDNKTPTTASSLSSSKSTGMIIIIEISYVFGATIIAIIVIIIILKRRREKFNKSNTAIISKEPLLDDGNPIFQSLT